jgi:hypothetical protein
MLEGNPLPNRENGGFALRGKRNTGTLVQCADTVEIKMI